MERIIFRRDTDHAAMLVPDISSSKLLLLLRTDVSESKPPSDLSNLLAIISGEIAHMADDTEQKNGAPDKHLCGITWPLVCAPESGISLSENEESARPSTDFSPKMESSSQFSHVVDELLPVLKSELVFGRNHEEQQLLSQLLGPNQGGAQLSVIPVVGMGGIGKTTLARLVYEDERVQKHFELKAWVKVGGRVLNQLQDIARKIIKAATGMSCSLTNLDELDEMVSDSLLSQRSLIVLDEIESMDKESWLYMKDCWFSFLGLGSKLIITTSNKEIVNFVASKPFELGELSPDASWSLYSSLAFGYSNVMKDVGLIQTARRLAARCKGVALSLKLLGSLVRFEESLIEVLSRGQMERITSFLHISIVLSMSVLALPQDLFNCFAYCGIFPRGYVLEKEKLIRMWIAEGLVKPSMGLKSREDTGDAYFHQLLSRSFFTDITCNEFGDIVQVRMPGEIHKFAQEIVKNICRGKVGYVVGVDQDSDCLSLASPFGEDYNTKHLRTLIVSPSIRIPAINPNRSILGFKSLESLDLSSSGIQKLSDHISALKKLRYLNLSDTPITRLPKSITLLVRLQTLDLSGCYYLQDLPKKISNLARMRHLDLSECNSLSYVPSGIGYLSSLISMPLFVLSQTHKRGAGLRELHKLNDLRGVLHIRNLENVKEVAQAQSADLKHKKLHHLGLSWSHSVDECLELLESLEPNPKIRVMDLTGYGAYAFPSWMPKLNSLVKLSIQDCKCIQLPALGQLPSLEELLLEGLANISSIDWEFYGTGTGVNVFPSLRKFKLYGLPNLMHWSSDATAYRYGDSGLRLFPSLKTLSIQGCPQLQSLPSLPSVKELVVWSSNSKILPLLSGIESLSSLLINEMEVGESLGGIKTLSTVDKLVVIHSTNLVALTSYHVNKFTALTHLSILRCAQLESVDLSGLHSLGKLSIVDCEDFKDIHLGRAKLALTELVIEDCPQLVLIEDTTSFEASLRKLIVRNCPLFSILPGKIRRLQALEFLFIRGCPTLERQLEDGKLPIAHVHCVILRDRKTCKTFSVSKCL